MYLYWTLNSDNPDLDHNDFNFTERYDGKDNMAYTLKEGEHLYYTNSKKQDLVYYGAGTLIVRGTETPILRKYTYDGEVSEEDIMTNGLAADIPWQPYNLSGDKGLLIIENQYVSLTEGDTIVSIDNVAPSTGGTDWNSWVATDTAEYRLAEDETNSSLPPLVVDTIKWSVRSRLDFNMSKTLAQPLHRGDSLKVYLKDDKGTLSDKTIAPVEDKNWEPVYINSNYTCQAATDTLDMANLLESGIKLKLKASSQSTPTISNTENLALNNYINGDAKYTKFDFANLPSDHEAGAAAFSLNLSIPQNDFGLIAVYYIKGKDEAANAGAYLEAADGNTLVNGLRIFNTAASLDSTDSLGTKLYLKTGLNIIEVKPNVKQLKIYADTNKKSNIIFGNLDIVADINPKLDYRITDTTGDNKVNSALEQLLRDLKNSGVADDFYYNVPIQRSNEIDLNGAIEDDKLSSPLAWYDPNNVNRKFVISEVDADYLATGITLTKASRV
jgi:hypothetical protein